MFIVLATLAMAGVAVERYPAIWLQPGARTYVAEQLTILLAYAVVIAWIMRRRGTWWDTAVGVAAIFGLISGAMEAINIACENGLLPASHGPMLPVVFQLSVFLVWGVAGWRATRVLGSVRGGGVTAALSAGVCMIIGVGAGFLVEFFVAPPALDSVLTWGEYLRSGWTDPLAFRIANTLDSATTHLLLGPFVALVLGGVGAWIGRLR